MHADKWAPLGAVLAAFCLLEVGPVVSAVSAVGLGALLDLWVLLPLFLALLGVTLWSLAIDRRYHRSPAPSRLTWLAGALVLAAYWTADVLAWVGVAALAAAAVWNHMLVDRLPERRARAREVSRRLG